MDPVEPGKEKAHFALWPLPDLSGRGSAIPSMLTADGDAATEAVSNDRYEEGLSAGRAEGQREAEARLQSALAGIEAAHQALVKSRHDLLTENENNLHSLAIAVARQIIQREIELDPDIVAALVRRALDEIKAEGPVEVRINPADFAAMAQARETLNHTWPDNMQWVQDPTMERGGCVVEGDNRMIDGRLDAALIDLFNRLNDV